VFRKKIYPGERRVALVPAVLPTLTKAGFEVQVQSGAGIEAGYPDSQYSDKGAKTSRTFRPCFPQPTSSCRSSATARTTLPAKQDVPLFHRDQIVIGFLRPFGEGSGAGNRPELE